MWRLLRLWKKHTSDGSLESKEFFLKHSNVCVFLHCPPGLLDEPHILVWSSTTANDIEQLTERTVAISISLTKERRGASVGRPLESFPHLYPRLAQVKGLMCPQCGLFAKMGRENVGKCALQGKG